MHSSLGSAASSPTSPTSMSSQRQSRRRFTTTSTFPPLSQALDKSSLFRPHYCLHSTRTCVNTAGRVSEEGTNEVPRWT